MMMLNYVHNGYLNKCDGVAENTLLPSGDHFNRETFRKVSGFSPGTQVSSANKTDWHDIAEIMLTAG
jgi:hypothetical protein